MSRAPRHGLRGVSRRLEVHEHCYVHGPNAGCVGRYKFEHSHAAGDTPHEHPDTGPSAFMIDKDEWYAATGLHGGGRKQYTAAPRGPQMARVELAPHQRTFRVVFHDQGLTAEHQRAGLTAADLEAQRAAFQNPDRVTAGPPGSPGTGDAAVARMALTFGMTPRYEYRDSRPAPAPALVPLEPLAGQQLDLWDEG
jgi:hypothetical protein